MTNWGRFRNLSAVKGQRGFPSRPALERFREKCEFDPRTGCVLWTGAKCWGRGHTIRYGGFRDEGKIWLAHRWSAKHIHGFDIDGLQVDHCCPLMRGGDEPMLPNTLCVEHVRPATGEHNLWLQTWRRRQFVHIQVGILPYEEIYGPETILDPKNAIPFYTEPKWLTGERSCPESDFVPF